MSIDSTYNALAIDFGASGGRAILGSFDGSEIRLKELYRFANEPVMLGDCFYWDILRLYHEIIHCLSLTQDYQSVAVDTWGVDFCLLDEKLRLISNPFHYRDTHTNGISSEVFKSIDAEKLYSLTGNQIMEINSLFRLVAIKRDLPWAFESAEHLLMIPDYFNYLLTGRAVSERSIASTTQLLSPSDGQWQTSVLSELGLDGIAFPEVVPSGSILGKLSAQLRRKHQSIPDADVIAACSHDTQCAIAAIPSNDDDFAFISLGTWAIVGTELDEPKTDSSAYHYNITNEAGYGGKNCFMKNVTGLWLIQEARRYYSSEKEISFSELELAASQSSYDGIIDTDEPCLSEPYDIPKKIAALCAAKGYSSPDSIGDIMRCIYLSLSAKFAQALSEISACSGKSFSKIHVIGGGVRAPLLCQCIANASALPVLAGPVEATSLGNIAIQLIAKGQLESIAQARKVIANSSAVREYSPNS